MKRNFCILIIFILAAFFCFFILSFISQPKIIQNTQAQESAIIIDHTCTDLLQVPQAWIDKAKQDFKLAYGHTSHGSQIVTGMQILAGQSSAYSYTAGNTGFLCDSCFSGAYDLGNPDRTAWIAATRSYLNGTGSNRNVIIWSWCGQVDATQAEIQSYLDSMNQLEQEFPNVKFVYMTGHLNGTGPSGNVYQRNNQIRDYCRTHNKILFDFADIESYNPDGQYYPAESDACNWCTAWCSTRSCPTCPGDCAHSHCFNCYQKGKAFWWMMARLAGWNSGSTPPAAYLLPDLNHDRQINASDFNLFKPLWGTSQADFNDDSKTDSKDFGIMMSKWGSY